MKPKRRALDLKPDLGRRPQTRTNPRSAKTAKIRPHTRTESRRELNSVARYSNCLAATLPIHRASMSNSILHQRPPRP
eukprot:5394337-Alexandrium_andersonii.AAC.1